MFNFVTVVFNLIEEAEAKMRSQEFNSIDIYQLKMDLERAENTLKRLPRNYLDKPTAIRSNFLDLHSSCQTALVSLAFNLGSNGLSKF